MTLHAFFHDYFTRLKCKIYEKCCNNHHTRPGHTFAIVTISKYVLDLQRVLSVSFIKTSKSWNVIKNIYCKIQKLSKHEVLQNLQNKFVQIWVFHDFFHDLLNSMTFPWPIIFHDFSMTFPWPVIFHDFSMTVGTLYQVQRLQLSSSTTSIIKFNDFNYQVQRLQLSSSTTSIIKFNDFNYQVQRLQLSSSTTSIIKFNLISNANMHIKWFFARSKFIHKK